MTKEGENGALKQKLSRRDVLTQRMLNLGLYSMSTIEVVELMLYYTMKANDVRTVAEAMVARFGTTSAMASASSAERLSVPGMNKRTDEHFSMIGMFIPHVMRSRFGEYPILSTVEKLCEFCAAIHVTSEYEALYVLCLNANFRLIKKEIKLGGGTPMRLNVELKHIMDAVANTATVHVVLCHNHPSGESLPSKADIEFTVGVKHYLDYVDINLHDHIIVADNASISMRELGYLHTATDRNKLRL